MIPASESSVISPSHNDVELAGYHACAEEAVLYLVNTEKLAPSDPIVGGLAQHLKKRQAHLEYQRLLDAMGGNKCTATQRSRLILAAYKGCDLQYS